MYKEIKEGNRYMEVTRWNTNQRHSDNKKTVRYMKNYGLA